MEMLMNIVTIPWKNFLKMQYRPQTNLREISSEQNLLNDSAVFLKILPKHWLRLILSVNSNFEH